MNFHVLWKFELSNHPNIKIYNNLIGIFLIPITKWPKQTKNMRYVAGHKIIPGLRNLQILFNRIKKNTLYKIICKREEHEHEHEEESHRKQWQLRSAFAPQKGTEVFPCALRVRESAGARANRRKYIWMFILWAMKETLQHSLIPVFFGTPL